MQETQIDYDFKEYEWNIYIWIQDAEKKYGKSKKTFYERIDSSYLEKKMWWWKSYINERQLVRLIETPTEEPIIWQIIRNENNDKQPAETQSRSWVNNNKQPETSQTQTNKNWNNYSEQDSLPGDVYALRMQVFNLQSQLVNKDMVVGVFKQENNELKTKLTEQEGRVEQKEEEIKSYLSTIGDLKENHEKEKWELKLQAEKAIKWLEKDRSFFQILSIISAILIIGVLCRVFARWFISITPH